MKSKDLNKSPMRSPMKKKAAITGSTIKSYVDFENSKNSNRSSIDYFQVPSKNLTSFAMLTMADDYISGKSPIKEVTTDD